MADFSNFELYEVAREPHWPHEIADGVITEMAQVFRVELSATPSSVELGRLVGAIGRSSVLRENLGQVQEVLGKESNALEITADWVERSGVQKPLNRSLWTPNVTSPEDDLIIASGGVANWQDRTATLLENQLTKMVKDTASNVVIPVGNRVMDTPTELVNPNVIGFREANGHLPTEAQYAEDVIKPRLSRVGYSSVYVNSYDTNNGDEIAAKFAGIANYSLLTGKYTFARVANAGVQLAVQFRKAIQAQKPDFDSSVDSAQVFILTDTFPIARTEDEAKDAGNFQNPNTAIRQVALTAKLLQETVEQTL